MWYSAFLETLRDTLAKVEDHFPTVAGAVALVLVGWGLARLLSVVGRRVVDRVLARLEASSAVRGALEGSGARSAAPRLVAGFVFWLVLAFFCAAAVETLGLPVMTELMARFVEYLPKVLAASLVTLAGLIIARVVRAAVDRGARVAGIAQSAAVASLVHGVVVVVAVVIAIEQLGLSGRVLELIVAVTIGSGLLAAALAFGLGARGAVANMVAGHYVGQLLRIGQAIEIDGIEGTVAELTATSVIVESHGGRVVVPAARFHESSVVLPTEEV